MPAKPYIFIGSSSEGHRIAEAVQINLDNVADTTVWTQNAFELSSTYIESLDEQLEKADFAIMILTEDDITISRKQKKAAPRDNVIFELGMAVGKLGRERCYFIYNNSDDIKLPSDLSGVNGATYRIHDTGNITASLGPASAKIREKIATLGLRPKIKQETVDAYMELNNFCDRIEGYWWERMKPNTASAISYVKITQDKENLVLKFDGQSYDLEGNEIAYWTSEASSINCKNKEIIYYWKGFFPLKPAEPFEGVGKISFVESDKEIKKGYGVFSNINITDLKSINKLSFELRKCSKEELTVMDSHDKNKIGNLVKKKLAEMP